MLRVDGNLLYNCPCLVPRLEGLLTLAENVKAKVQLKSVAT